LGLTDRITLEFGILLFFWVIICPCGNSQFPILDFAAPFMDGKLFFCFIIVQHREIPPFLHVLLGTESFLDIEIISIDTSILSCLVKCPF
jgi:hypothetical protein